MRQFWVFLLCVVSQLIIVKRVYAYLDPGTGSMILQAVLAAIVGSAVAIKIFWRRIKSLCLRLVGKGNPGNPTQTDAK
jgi:hypothetical protein